MDKRYSPDKEAVINSYTIYEQACDRIDRPLESIDSPWLFGGKWKLVSDHLAVCPYCELPLDVHKGYMYRHVNDNGNTQKKGYISLRCIARAFKGNSSSTLSKYETPSSDLNVLPFKATSCGELFINIPAEEKGIDLLELLHLDVSEFNRKLKIMVKSLPLKE